MIKLTEDRRKIDALGALYIGSSADERHADKEMSSIDAILNVAQDLNPTRCWPVIEYMHVGLIDGPGNELSAYCGAVLALRSLLKLNNVLVCCHTGGRSLAVSIMLMRLNVERSWEDLWSLIHERVDVDLPKVNEVHKTAFSKIHWDKLREAIK